MCGSFGTLAAILISHSRQHSFAAQQTAATQQPFTAGRIHIFSSLIRYTQRIAGCDQLIMQLSALYHLEELAPTTC